MTKALEVKNLNKRYGNKNAINNVSFSIDNGKIVGLLGPNGSGKTTFIKMAVGLLKKNSGEIIVDGTIVGVETKALVSYLPDKDFLYKWMKIKDAIQFFIDFYDDFDEEKCEKLLSLMKLDNNQKIKTLSKGMLEKLHLTLVLSRNAKLYVLDEPIAGVDPVAREKILNAIIENFSGEGSMLITTHLVRDIEKLFDDVLFIKEGRIVKQGNAEDIRLENKMSIDEIFRDIFAE
ncbi:ABC transporter ATP-binding protein [Clostridium sp. DL1XJH146]